MYIENDTIHFKSSEPYYTKEKSGIKNNTIRYISKKENNLILLTVGIQNIKKICITNIKTKDCFIRKLSDISIINKYNMIYIFLWRG